MERIPVTSSQLVSIGYDPGTQTLEIEFKSFKAGAPTSVYQYTSVPVATWDGLRKAESHGKYFGQNIKGKFAYTKIS